MLYQVVYPQIIWLQAKFILLLDFMNYLKVFFKIRFKAKLFFTDAALMLFEIFMNALNVSS